MKSIVHRDQVHGDVRLDPLGVALLNTASLQRLGRIYQLGYAHLVYRGGTHTRLSHVMGAAHVAGKLVDLLRQNYLAATDLPRGAADCGDFLPKSRKRGPDKISDEARWDVLRHLVRWAALLHDVGHIPLGHTLEDEFAGIYVKHDAFSSRRISHLWHETAPGQDSEIRSVFRREELFPRSFGEMGITGEQAWQTVMLICLHKEESRDGTRKSFKELLAKDEATIPFVKVLHAAMSLTEGTTFFPYMADIVGNTICADYLDYLRRDPLNVGLDVLRDDRIASRFFVGKDSNGFFRMALALVDRRGKPRLDTCTGVVELVRQRFRFAEIIYYHKTKVAASAMLARVLALIGKPDEFGADASTIEIDEIQELAKRVASAGDKDFEVLKRGYYPSTLLDPSIGDETLLFWLQDIAWAKLERSRQSKDSAVAENCLRGLALLQALVRRRLYKTCFTIDQKNYAELTPGSKEQDAVDRGIKNTLADLRDKGTRRGELESRMATAAGWPPDSLLLYVPPRKVQAKGIETGALDKGEVVTLGMHSAVSAEVLRLNDAYKGLWRIILLVHPKYQQDVLGFSRAVDVLLAGIWPRIDVATVHQQIRHSAWVSYIPEKNRLAAGEYKKLMGSEHVDWASFEDAGYKTTDGTVSTDEHASRAVLLAMVAARGGSFETVRKNFAMPDSLSQRVLELRKEMSVEGREGATPNEIKRGIIETIARELTGEAASDSKLPFRAASKPAAE